SPICASRSRTRPDLLLIGPRRERLARPGVAPPRGVSLLPHRRNLPQEPNPVCAGLPSRVLRRATAPTRCKLLARAFGGLELRALGISAQLAPFDAAVAGHLRVRELGHAVGAHAAGVGERLPQLILLFLRSRLTPVRQQSLAGSLCALELRCVRF